MSSASDAVVDDTSYYHNFYYIVCRDGFLALRASGCAGLGNRHTGQGVVSYQSSFNIQLTIIFIIVYLCHETPSHARVKLL